MIRKLLSQLKSFFTSKKEPWYENIPMPEKTPTDYKEDYANSIKDIIPDNIKLESLQKLEQPSQVEVNLDTGKIVFPDNMSPEDKAMVEEALQELQKSFQSFTEDQFQSFEDFLKESDKTGRGFQTPFITANSLPEAQLQVLEEMENSKDDTEHWSDSDFIEALFGYYNQGYDFPGIETMANKVNDKLELSQSEQKQLRDWYMLASQELVYDV